MCTRWLCRSSSFLLPSVADIMSESFMGAVDDMTGSVNFASVDDMVRVRLAHGSRLVEFLRSLSGIGEARMSRSAASMSGASLCRAVIVVQSSNRCEEARVSDGMVGCLGASVSIGVSKIPLGSDG